MSAQKDQLADQITRVESAIANVRNMITNGINRLKLMVGAPEDLSDLQARVAAVEQSILSLPVDTGADEAPPAPPAE